MTENSNQKFEKFISNAKFTVLSSDSLNSFILLAENADSDS